MPVHCLLSFKQAIMNDGHHGDVTRCSTSLLAPSKTRSSLTHLTTCLYCTTLVCRVRLKLPLDSYLGLLAGLSCLTIGSCPFSSAPPVFRPQVGPNRALEGDWIRKLGWPEKALTRSLHVEPRPLPCSRPFGRCRGVAKGWSPSIPPPRESCRP